MGDAVKLSSVSADVKKAGRFFYRERSHSRALEVRNSDIAFVTGVSRDRYWHVVASS